MNKLLQRVVFDLWFNTVKSHDTLYIVELFELKTVEEDIVAEVSVNAAPEKKRASNIDDEAPSPSKVSKRKMLDLSLLRNFSQCQVGSLFSFKNRLFLKVSFKPIISNFQLSRFDNKQRLRQKGRRFGSLKGIDRTKRLSHQDDDSNKSDDEESDEDEDDDDEDYGHEVREEPSKHELVIMGGAIHSMKLLGTRNSEHN